MRGKTRDSKIKTNLCLQKKLTMKQYKNSAGSRYRLRSRMAMTVNGFLVVGTPYVSLLCSRPVTKGFLFGCHFICTCTSAIDWNNLVEVRFRGGVIFHFGDLSTLVSSFVRLLPKHLGPALKHQPEFCHKNARLIAKRCNLRFHTTKQ